MPRGGTVGHSHGTYHRSDQFTNIKAFQTSTHYRRVVAKPFHPAGKIKTDGCCFRENFRIPMIVSSVILVVLAIVFVAIVFTVPMYSGELCDGITNVSLGEIPVCHVRETCTMHCQSSSETSLYIFCNKIVVNTLFIITFTL